MKLSIKVSTLRVLCATLLLAPLAFAAPGEGKADGARPDRPGGGRLIQGMQKVTTDLNLSAEQQAKVDAILAEMPAKLREFAQQTQDMEPRDRGTRLRELLAEARTAVEAELTAEQKVQFTEKLDAAAAERKERRGDRNVDPNTSKQQQPGAQLIERMESAIAKLDLSAEQTSQAEKVIADLKVKLDDIRANANGDVEAARTEAREAFGNARKEIGQALDPEQRQKLRELMQADAPDRPAKGGDKQKRRDAEAKPDQNAAPPTTAPGTSSNTKPAADAAGLALIVGSLTRAGEPIPDIALLDLNGKSIALRSLIKTRPLVLVTGSYTSPIFRDHVPDLRDMKRTLAGKADLCIVYVAEAHPAGAWDIERNRDAGISAPAHDSQEARLAAANNAKKQLDLDVPIVCDTMTNAFLSAVNNRPNAGVLLARDGKVLLFQNWFEPHALRRAIEALRSYEKSSSCLKHGCHDMALRPCRAASKRYQLHVNPLPAIQRLRTT